MAVLFPRPAGQPNFAYSPNNPAQLLQGFIGLMEITQSRNGELTRANLDSYQQIRFFAPDPNSNVADYLSQNFAFIAAQDGNANSISANDLVQVRNNLPQYVPSNNNSGNNGNNGQPLSSNQLMSLVMVLLLGMLGGLFGQSSPIAASQQASRQNGLFGSNFFSSVYNPFKVALQ